MTAAELIKLEKLNQILLSEEEREIVLSYFAMADENEKYLDKYDVSETEPMIYVVPLRETLREDVCVQTFSREDLLEGAPKQHDGYWQIPRLLE